jgi:hypothetical protein
MKPSKRKYKPLNLTVLFEAIRTKQSALLNPCYRVSLGLQFLVCENDIHHAEVMLLQGPIPYTPVTCRQTLSYSRISQHCMEPRDSLQRPEEPSIGPYPKQDESSPYHHIVLL